MTREENPRYNAPPCLSHLLGDARKRALLARHQSALDAYIAQYRHPGRPRTLRDRLLDLFNPPVGLGRIPSATQRSRRDRSVEAGPITFIDPAWSVGKGVAHG